MHGRKKSDLPQTPDEKAAVRTKISNYKKVITAVQLKRASGEVDNEFKELLSKMLRLHPDYYSMWNYRKEAVLQEISRIGEGEGKAEALSKICREELALSVDCIKRNPKSYPAWHHHQWAMSKGLEYVSHEDAGRRDALQDELALCATFLDLDGRNFHCWAYRMWVADKAGLSAQEDFKFTTEKIMQNFSNYSAFHVRSKLLDRMVTEEGRDQSELLNEELDLAHQAMFTEPADQSVWWYHHFLLSWAEEKAKDAPEQYQHTLREEASTLQELIDVEGWCKWAELALFLVTERLMNTLRHGSCVVDGTNDDTEEEKLAARCRHLASRLSDRDPVHKRFYAFIQSGGSVRGHIVSKSARSGGMDC